MASSEDEFEDAVESLDSLPNNVHRVFSPITTNGGLLYNNDQTPSTSKASLIFVYILLDSTLMF